MDGLTALEEVRRVAPRSKYVVVTAHGSLDTAVRAMKVGAVEYLAKPVELDQARSLIQASLKGAGVNREVESLRQTGRAGRDRRQVAASCRRSSRRSRPSREATRPCC
jgi:DNA-binding NtrC family response regulator